MELAEGLFRVLADWVQAWPGWLRWLVVVAVTPVMVLHFLAWVGWRLGLLDPVEDDDGTEVDNVVPLRRR